MNLLLQPVTKLTSVGTQTVHRLEKLGIYLVQDLLFHLPYRYEDRTRLSSIASLSVGNSALVYGQVDVAEVLPKGRRCLVCRISDGTGFLSLKFFHYSSVQLQALKPGTWLSCYAEVRYGFAGLEMVHPDITVIPDVNTFNLETCLTPVYPLTEGLSQNTLRKLIKQALLQSSQLMDWIPASLLAGYSYPGLTEALQQLHAPNESVSSDALQDGSLPARKRLALEELLSHYLSLKLLKDKAEQWQAPRFLSPDNEVCQPRMAQFIQGLPFQLTEAQQRVINEITLDCLKPLPMLRLIQGDVGSGKTVVSAYAALLAVMSGYQVAIMAPTELLAEQHKRNFSTWLAPLSVEMVFLTGQLKGKQRTQVLQRLADGSANIVVGTHALFQESVVFAKLGLIIIDEQHRFGVHQRLALREKALPIGLRPHQLVMTATPIPRTLAMLHYADLDISIIDQLPPGRKPIVTSAIPSERRLEVIERIAHWVAKSKQAYWVCTLIEESDVLQCEAAEQTASRLQQALPSVRVGLIHGRLKSAEKDAIMQAFKHQQIDLLVATTVIEVGVDVANAGLMIIENPERLGLSQLHQLRGRVGRSSDESYCLLMYQPPLSDNARLRLGILRDSNDGFVIAEKDLQLRGPGEVMGTRQTGAVHFKVADLAKDAELLESIQSLGEQLCKVSPAAAEALSERWLGTLNDYAKV